MESPIPANAAWLALAAICHNLTRAAGCLAGQLTSFISGKGNIANPGFTTDPTAAPATARTGRPPWSRRS